MFLARIFTAVFFAPVILIISGLGNPIHMLILTILICFVGIIEFNDLSKKREVDINSLLTTLGTILIPIIFYVVPSLSLYIFIVLLFVTMGIYLFRKDKKGFITGGAVSLFGIFYIGWTLGHLVLIRNLDRGNYFLVILFLGVWAVDVSAYLIGSLIGRHKIFPDLSPNKTLEGTIAGIVLGTLSLVGLSYLFITKCRPGILTLIIIGLFTALLATFGDLVESAIKRDAGVKDSGDFLPGHGGVLDRFDSTIFAAPIFYYLIKLLTKF